MIEEITITVNGKDIKTTKGITLLQFSKQFMKDFAFPIILAKVNNSYRELSYILNQDVKVEFFDVTSRVGNRSYIAGLTFLLFVTVKELYGMDADIIVQHSLDKGIYIKTTFSLNESILEAISSKMRDMISMNLDIMKVNVERVNAISYFKGVGDLAKARIMKYNTNTYVTLYQLGSYYNYFYHKMPVSTGVLKDFILTYLNEFGFMLQFPTIYSEGKISDYQHHPHMFDVFKENRQWAKLMRIENISDLNYVVSKGEIADLIRMDETLQSNRLLEVAKEIQAKKKKIVLLAGPSSSGKTTTTTKLCMYLRSLGLRPKMISMDDYFVEREDTPKNELGEYNYECFEAIDSNLLNEQMSLLLKGERVILPVYNFLEGKKEFKKEFVLEEDDILLMEGIHSLNPKVLENIDGNDKFKIYLSALTELNIDNHNRFPTTDNRLLRRIVRDNRTRGYQVEDTLRVWPQVRAGEESYIFPYQDEADVTFNTALIYEIGVLKTYAEPLLYSVDESSPYYEEAKRLLNILRLILPIASEDIPDDSIIREFIGRSCYHA